MYVAATAEEIFHMVSKPQKGRGINVYSFTELMTSLGTKKDGTRGSAKYQLPLFTLSLDERTDIFRYCSPVFGVVTSRMNRISGLNFIITPDKKDEDKIANFMKNCNAVYKEYEKRPEFKYQIARGRLRMEVMNQLPDVLPDLSNFNSALLRWKRQLQSEKQDRAQEIQDWLAHPNVQDSWSTFVKKWVFDFMVHGASVVYKEVIEKQIENFYLLPSGTVLPVRSEYVGGMGAYIQLIAGFEPQLFFQDEVSYATNVPISTRSYGAVPLEALTNKVAETLLFDRLMAEQADGTKPPEKVVIFGDVSPFGGTIGEFKEDFSVPADKESQRRIELKLSEAKKGAIATLTGVGHPIVLDMTRENTMGIQIERQKIIREEVALVFNMSNMEVNLTGSEDTSGRNTSESQERIELGKGIAPIVSQLEECMNHDIIPFRFGSGYKIELQPSKDSMGEITKWRDMLQSGLYAVNEIRTDFMNEPPFKGEQFDAPSGQPPTPPPPGQNPQNPMNVAMVK